MSPATRGITIAVTGSNGFARTVVLGLTPSSPGCSVTSTGTQCRLSIGTFAACAVVNCYTATVNTYDAVTCGTSCTIPAGAHELSAAQSVPFTVSLGKANVLSFTLGGIPASVAVTPLHAGFLQGDTLQMRLYGAQPQGLVVTALDADGNPIVGAGAPAITATSAGTTLVASNPAAGAPNVVTLGAATSGSPAVVTPGIVNLTLRATPASQSGGSAVAVTVPVTIKHSGVYIGDESAITVYYDGNTATPSVTLVGANTGLGLGVNGIAVDDFGTIYATVQGAQAIYEFAAGLNGNAAPTTTIGGGLTGLSSPISVAVDSHGTVYAANVAANDVTEYIAGSNGNAFPTATLAGSATLLSGPEALAFDRLGTLYAESSANSTVSLFAPGSNGNVLTNSLSGANTGLNGAAWLTLLPDGTLCAIQEDPSSHAEILEFAPGATGNAAPVRTIAGASTGMSSVSGLAADADGTLYAVNDATVTEYALGASGNAAPLATITPSHSVTYSVAVVPAATGL